MHNYIQYADPPPVDGLSSVSFPEDFHLPMLLYRYGHQEGLSTGHPRAYNAPPSRMEQQPPVDVNAEWMAILEKIPIHNPAINTSTQQPTHPKSRFVPQAANENSLGISPPEDRFHDHVVLNPSLPLSCIEDPGFTERVENTELAPVFVSPRQNDPGHDDFIMCGSLDICPMDTPGSYQCSDTLLGTLFHFWGHSVS